MLIDALADRSLAHSPPGRVCDLRVGLGYTAVLLDNGRCGLAYTFRDEAKEGCCVIGEAGTITGRQAMELVAWAKSPAPIAAAVGLATVNALTDPPVAAVESNLLAALTVGPDDVIGMVGFFGPLIEPLRIRARQLHIFERRPEDRPGTLTESKAQDLLPQCHIVILSATAILNRTIDGLLDLCGPARELVVLGPSTPFVPEVFQPRGVTLLSGIHVVDAAHVLRIVAEGGGTRQLGGAVRKLTLRISPSRY
jgi:uncharacterized protein (DUF4213/DUF364 family)